AVTGSGSGESGGVPAGGGAARVGRAWAPGGPRGGGPPPPPPAPGRGGTRGVAPAGGGGGGGRGARGRGPPRPAPPGGAPPGARAGGDRRVAQIVLTHGHLDHSAGAARFAAMSGAPVGALDPALRLGDEGFVPGDVLVAAGVVLRIVGTPGHSADSLSLLLEADGALLTGDTVLGRGTTVIGPDGS